MFNFRLSLEEFYIRVGLGWPKWMPWFNNTWSWYKDKLFTKHKAGEIQIECDFPYLFEFEFQLNRCEDHAGLRFTLALLKHWISASIYDTRHWNQEKNRYYNETDYDDMMFTEEEATAKITEIAHKIKGGVKDNEVKALLKELPHSEMKVALLGKLAEWQYSTEASRVAKIIYELRFEEAWWIDRTGPKKAK